MSEDYNLYENEAVSKELQEKLSSAGFGQDLALLMKDVRMRKFMFHLLYQVCGLDDCTFTGNSRTYFLEGKREVGRFMHEMVQEHCFIEYLNMLSEINSGFDLEKETK
jgi:hypothetical protein